MDEPVRIGGEGPQPEAMRPGPTAPPRRVLVVDDDDISGHGLALILRFEGYEVQVARDGESALRVARAFRPEAVLSDIGLPGIDGHELARLMRRDRDLSAGLKLLAAITGQGEPEARRRSREAGFDRHFVKPVDPEVILAMLASLEWREERLVLKPSPGG